MKEWDFLESMLHKNSLPGIRGGNTDAPYLVDNYGNIIGKRFDYKSRIGCLRVNYFPGESLAEVINQYGELMAFDVELVKQA